ncbi:MAG: hypothetical protein EXR57_00715 [Dehalococcoidia bacterium]|nr:hypothetical protein [Dehalococcoidia bacterium]MSQ34325.1 hypothetical protein [Dehalococcoidia bacterium]
MGQFFILAASDTAGVRDVLLVAGFVLVFFFLLFFAVLGILLYRQMSRLSSRVESGLSRMESGLEKFESAAETVTGLAGTVSKAVAGMGTLGLGKIIGRLFGGSEKAEGQPPGEEKQGRNDTERR